MVAGTAFHEGECAAQTRVGVREKMRAIGQHAIRDFMPDQHRELFSKLPFVIVGTVDNQGQPGLRYWPDHRGSSPRRRRMRW